MNSHYILHVWTNSICKIPGDLALGHDGKPLEKDKELDDDNEGYFEDQMAENEFDVPVEKAHGMSDGEDELDPGLHSGWMFVDSDTDDEEPSGTVACAQSKITRARISEERPEFQELAKLGLVERPSGCTIGIHPEAMVWRASAPGCSHHGRSFTATCGRTAKQALLRVIQLMLADYLEKDPKDRLAKKQLSRVVEARAAEPKHAD